MKRKLSMFMVMVMILNIMATMAVMMPTGVVAAEGENIVLTPTEEPIFVLDFEDGNVGTWTNSGSWSIAPSIQTKAYSGTSGNDTKWILYRAGKNTVTTSYTPIAITEAGEATAGARVKADNMVNNKLVFTINQLLAEAKDTTSNSFYWGFGTGTTRAIQLSRKPSTGVWGNYVKEAKNGNADNAIVPTTVTDYKSWQKVKFEVTFTDADGNYITPTVDCYYYNPATGLYELKLQDQALINSVDVFDNFTTYCDASSARQGVDDITVTWEYDVVSVLEEGETVSKTALEAKIAEATETYNAYLANVGDQEGQYNADLVAALNAAIAEAQSVYDDATASQAAVNAQVVALDDAILAASVLNTPTPTPVPPTFAPVVNADGSTTYYAEDFSTNTELIDLQLSSWDFIGNASYVGYNETLGAAQFKPNGGQARVYFAPIALADENYAADTKIVAEFTVSRNSTDASWHWIGFGQQSRLPSSSNNNPNGLVIGGGHRPSVADDDNAGVWLYSKNYSSPVASGYANQIVPGNFASLGTAQYTLKFEITLTDSEGHAVTPTVDCYANGEKTLEGKAILDASATQIDTFTMSYVSGSKVLTVDDISIKLVDANTTVIEPNPEPTDEPIVEPTDEPTPEPTDEPIVEPTDEPTEEPTVVANFSYKKEIKTLAGKDYVVVTPYLENNTGFAALQLKLNFDTSKLTFVTKQVDDETANGSPVGKIQTGVDPIFGTPTYSVVQKTFNVDEPEVDLATISFVRIVAVPGLFESTIDGNIFDGYFLPKEGYTAEDIQLSDFSIEVEVYSDLEGVEMERTVTNYEAVATPTPEPTAEPTAEPVVVNKSALDDALTAAYELYDNANANIGDEEGKYSQAVVTALMAAITSAQAVYDNADATQDDVDAAIVDLNKVVSTVVPNTATPTPEPTEEPTAPPTAAPADPEGMTTLYREDFEGLTADDTLKAWVWSKGTVARNQIGTDSTDYFLFRTGSSGYVSHTFPAVAVNEAGLAAGGINPGKNGVLTVEYRLKWHDAAAGGGNTFTWGVGNGTTFAASVANRSGRTGNGYRYLSTSVNENQTDYVIPDTSNGSTEKSDYNQWHTIKFVITLTDAEGNFVTPTVDAYGDGVLALEDKPLLGDVNVIDTIMARGTASSSSQCFDDINIYLTSGEVITTPEPVVTPEPTEAPTPEPTPTPSPVPATFAPIVNADGTITLYNQGFETIADKDSLMVDGAFYVSKAGASYTQAAYETEGNYAKIKFASGYMKVPFTAAAFASAEYKKNATITLSYDVARNRVSDATWQAVGFGSYENYAGSNNGNGLTVAVGHRMASATLADETFGQWLYRKSYTSNITTAPDAGIIAVPGAYSETLGVWHNFKYVITLTDAEGTAVTPTVDLYVDNADVPVIADAALLDTTAESIDAFIFGTGSSSGEFWLDNINVVLDKGVDEIATPTPEPTAEPTAEPTEEPTPTPVPVDKSALDNALTVAYELFDNANANVGEAEGQYSQAVVTALNAAIEAAQAVYDDPNADQAAVDQAIVDLNAVIATVVPNTATPTPEPTEEPTAPPTAPPAAALYGDANGDGEVDSTDATTVLLYKAGALTDSDINIVNADANGDGEVDSTDATAILLYKAGALDKLGPQ